MTKREVVRMALDFKRPPYVPWAFGFTLDARENLKKHYGDIDFGEFFQPHKASIGGPGGNFEDVGGGCVRDVYGVVWDRSVDEDIGVVKGQVLPEPTLAGYEFPDPCDPRFFRRAAETCEKHSDVFLQYSIGFSLYERAWTLRGMEQFMLDFRMYPDFAHELLDAICEHNIAQIEEALKYDIDAVHFGDDWGSQLGVQMGVGLWREFVLPRLRRMYGVARDAGKYVTIHSCGKVDELFDDLIDAGLNCFNPFQPEVMDVGTIFRKYYGKLAFHGGLSTQQTLPYGTVDDVKAEVNRLLEMGREGGYVFAPAHAVEGDVPTENMVAFIETAMNQPGFRETSGG